METTKETKDVYHQLLDIFLGYDVRRPVFCTPFINGDLVVSTDASSLIVFKKDLLEEIYFENELRAPNIDPLLKDEDNTDIEFDTSKLLKLYKSSKAEVKKRYIITDGKCPDCGGVGSVDFEFRDSEGVIHYEQFECPTCDDPRIEWKSIEDTKTGLTHESFKILFEIDGYYFPDDGFKKLIKAAETSRNEKIKLTYHPIKGAHHHRFTIGYCTVVLMPVLKDSVNDHDFIAKLT